MTSALPQPADLEAILRAAGDEALARFRDVGREHKADGSDVTAADLAAEHVIVERLRERWPDTGVLSEEGEHHGGVAGTWYVDPIDGTGSYLDQLAHWGPTVCLVCDGVIEVGALWLPRLEEFWYAARGAGAWRNGQRIVTPAVERVRRFHNLYLPSRFHRRTPIPWPGKVRALGSSAVHLAQVAAVPGAAAVIPRWEVWDVGCGILLVEEAGGVITDWAGEPFDPIARVGVPFLAGSAAAIAELGRHIPPPPTRIR